MLQCQDDPTKKKKKEKGSDHEHVKVDRCMSICCALFHMNEGLFVVQMQKNV